MRVQKLLTISSLILAGNVAFGADLDRDDVPSDCHSACDPLVSISQQCDRQNDNDEAEARCICEADNATSLIPQCEACIAEYSNDSDPHDNDAYDMLTACSLHTTSYTPSSSGGGSGTQKAQSTSRDNIARRVPIVLRPLITRLPLLASGPEDSIAHQVRTILRPFTTRLRVIGSEDNTARRARIILHLLITRLRLLVIGPEGSTAHRVHTILLPPISRNPLIWAGDSTAHQVHILRPVIAHLPRLVHLCTDDDKNDDKLHPTDIQGWQDVRCERLLYHGIM
ncbi:hypothetical protein BDW68DRAFT_176420 [Aspergillus falconensis]